MLIENVESYAAYVAAAIINDNIDTGNATAILLNRTHIGMRLGHCSLCHFNPKHYSSYLSKLHNVYLVRQGNTSSLVGPSL